MTFKLWSIDDPSYLKGVLPLFRGGKSYTNKELVEITPTIGLSSSVKQITRLQQSWYVLGILNRELDEHRAYRYKISKFGESLLNQLQFNESIAIEIGHWLWYSAWSQAQNFDWGWSYVYQETCNRLWEESPSQVVPKKLLASVLETTNINYKDQNPSFDIASIRSVTAWLAAFSPPFIYKKDTSDVKSPLLSCRRESCSPELFILALQLQYKEKNLPYGTSLLIDETTLDAVCKMCLLSTDFYWPMVNLSMLTFPDLLLRKETMYGTSLMVTSAAPFTPPKPCPLGT